VQDKGILLGEDDIRRLQMEKEESVAQAQMYMILIRLTPVLIIKRPRRCFIMSRCS
jgi:hypothetical protein